MSPFSRFGQNFCWRCLAFIILKTFHVNDRTLDITIVPLFRIVFLCTSMTKNETLIFSTPGSDFPQSGNVVNVAKGQLRAFSRTSQPGHSRQGKFAFEVLLKEAETACWRGEKWPLLFCEIYCLDKNFIERLLSLHVHCLLLRPAHYLKITSFCQLYQHTGTK